MPTFRHNLLAYIQRHPGLSDRQLADALDGRERPQQRVNGEARLLASRGQISRRRRADGIIGNYPPDKDESRGREPTLNTLDAQPEASNETTRARLAGDGVPECPIELPAYVGESVQLLGKLWAGSSVCPHIAPEVIEGWDELLAQWRDDQSMPLLIRKASSAVRGSELEHSTERPIVPTDNSPAQWSCSLALQGIVPKIGEVRTAFENDTLPVSFAHKKHEKTMRRYHCTLGKYGVNKAGWKLCHIKPVGLTSRSSLATVPIQDLKTAFFRLMSPSNYFLIPLKWSGLGEVPEFIDGYMEWLRGNITEKVQK